MTQDEKYFVWLSSFEFMLPKKCHALLDFYESGKNIFLAFKNREQHLNELFPAEYIATVCEKADELFIENYLRNLADIGVTPITFLDERYPTKLLQTPDYPLVLYTKGDISLLQSRCFAVVGTRNPSTYGKNVTHDITKVLARAGLTIVSGLASGIDSVSHQASLEVKGKTIAVLGNGFNYIYPKYNQNLYNEIAKNGLVITELAPSVRAQKYTFISRNRIIAGLSDGVLITEGSKTSGAMHTKEFAFDYNRNVYAVPGNINSEASEGPNMLIATSQAVCVLSADDILKDLGIDFKQNKQNFQLDMFEQKIIQAIKNEPQQFDNLQIITQIEPKVLNSYLTTLTIRGIIKKLPGNFYSL